MIQPHGGQLIDRVLKGAALDEALKKAASPGTAEAASPEKYKRGAI